MTATALSVPARATSYSRFQRAAHWLTLLLVVALFTLAWSADSLPQDLHHQAIQLHRSLGVTLWLLTVARLAYRLKYGVPEERGLPDWQQRVARAVHWLLYGALLVEPLGGYLGTNLQGRAVPFFAVDLPSIAGKNRPLAHTVLELHEKLAWVILIAVALHAGAALYHHYVRKNQVLRQMVTG